MSGCSWNECPDQRGISVRMLVEWVSGCWWNGCPDGHGIPTIFGERIWLAYQVENECSFVKALRQPKSGCSPQLAGVAAGLLWLAEKAQRLLKQTDRKMENSLKPTFSSFSPSRTGVCSDCPPEAIQSPAVRSRCTSLPKFANYEMSDHL